MKQFIIAIVVLMFAVPAFAAESWVADGVQSVTASNANTTAVVMPFGRTGFKRRTLSPACRSRRVENIRSSRQLREDNAGNVACRRNHKRVISGKLDLINGG